MFEGVLRKMLVELKNDVNYFLDFDVDFLNINSLIKKKIKRKTFQN